MTAPVKSPVLLSIQGLTRRFGERTAVEGLSFDLFPGEVLGLLGPNGAGKSTAFQILAGLLRPTSGSVFFEGKPLGLSDPSLRSRMGVVFQRASLDLQLTAEENLTLSARLSGLSGARMSRRVGEMLELIELKDRAQEKVELWSGGMRRRLELARALIHHPSVLLMDEPTQGLDEASFRTFWAHLRGLRSLQGLTVLLTTHRPDEAAQCDRLVLMDSGKPILTDTPSALLERLGGDVIVLEADDLPNLKSELSTRLQLTASEVEGQLLVEQADGHLLIPRLIEAFPRGRLRAVSLRRPTLADAFLKLTGHQLKAELAAPAATPKKRRSA